MKTVRTRVAYKPHDGQRLFHAAFRATNPDGSRKHKIFVLNCGRRWGKDRASIIQYITEFIELDQRPPDPTRVPHTHGWIVAPTYPMAQQSWRELKAFMPKHLVRRVDNNKLIMETSKGGIIEVKSAHKPDDLVSVGLDLLLITEAARVPELAWQNLRPTLNSPGRIGIAVLNSTPKGVNWFARSYWLGQQFLLDGQPNPNYLPTYWSMTAPTLQNSYLSPDQQQEIINARFEMPDDVYAQEYEAKIVDNGSTVFRGVERVLRGSLLLAPVPGRRYVMGVDLGKVRDFTVMTVMDMESKQVVHWERINKLDWDYIIDEVVKTGRKWRVIKMMVDQTGVGEPVVDLLKKKFNTSVVEGYTSGSNKQKVDLIQPLQVAIEKQQVFFPKIDVLYQELTEYEYQITDSGNWTMSAPEGKHDDAVISLALAWRGASQRTMKMTQGYRRLYGRA